MGRSSRAGIGGLALVVLVLGAPWSARAQHGEPAASGGNDRAERARVYLGQSLTALGWAKRYAETAARTSVLPGFDLARYLAELETITHGLERYLQPGGPPPGPLTPVEITAVPAGRAPSPASTGERWPSAMMGTATAAEIGARPCPRILDEPLRFFGFDAEDGAVGLTLFTLLHLFGASFWGVVIGFSAAGVLLLLKRRHPPGIVLHRLWLLGLPLRPLPPSPLVTGGRRSPW